MTTIVVDSTDIVYLEHVVLTLNLTLHEYGTGFGESDFYDAYNYYYPNSDKGGEGFLDFEYDQLAADEPNNAASFQEWLVAPHPRRGDIQVELTSPQGTTSIMLPYRLYDFVNKEGYSSWPFMTVHHWGEQPLGDWIVTVRYKSSSGYVSAIIESMELYGTSIVPDSVAAIPDKCDPSCSEGCGGDGTGMCDVCMDARNMSTLECIISCNANDTLYNGYCIDNYAPGNPDTSCYLDTVLIVIICILVMLVGALIIGIFVAGNYFWRRKNKILARWKCDLSYSVQGQTYTNELMYT